MLILVLIIIFTSCQYCDGIEESVVQQFGEKVMNLSLELFYYTLNDNEGHVAMAPFTIWNLISLVAFRTSADSWAQFQSIIGIPKRNGKQFNSLFTHVTDSLIQKRSGRIYETKHVVFFDSSLEASMLSYFPKCVLYAGAHMKMLDFGDNVSAAEQANDYIQLSVMEYLPKLMVFDKTDFEESTMIVSAIVKFSAVWSLPFDESNSVLEDGYRGVGKVYMMRQWANVRYADIELLCASALELPYGTDREFSMIIIRPHRNCTVTDVLSNFSKITFIDVMNQLYSVGLRETEVKLPVFSITSTLILNGALTSMEATDVFLSHLADFSGITSEDIYIAALEHRTEVLVGEGGTVVIAHTPGNLVKNITGGTGRVTADPFLYFIVHSQYTSIVFCGKYGE